jgi:MFS family permease
MIGAAALTSAGAEGAAVAIALLVYAETGSTAWVSAALIASLGLAALLGPVGGVVADRYPRRRVMITVALCEVLIFAFLAAEHAATVLVVMAGVSAVVFLPFEASMTAELAAVVPDDRYPTVAGRMVAAQQLATLVAPLVAGVAVGTLPAGVTLGAVALLYAASALVLLGLPRDVEAAGGRAASFLQDLGEGLRALVGQGLVLAATISSTVLVIAAGSTLVAGVSLAHELGRGDSGYGLMVSTWGAGLVAGLLMSGRILGGRSVVVVLLIAQAAQGTALGSISLIPGYGGVLAALLVGGLGNGVAAAAYLVLTQRLVPNRLLGRVRAAAFSLNRAGYAASFLLGGVVVGIAGTRAAFAMAGLGGLLAAGILAATALTRSAPAPGARPEPSD